jgi:hypothetical protein
MDIEIEIAGEKEFVRNVPETSWEALRPFWPSIARSVIEVFLEGNFKPYGVRKNRKDGFYAGKWYWDRSRIDSEEYSLKEAKRFFVMLLKKDCFLESIRGFNKSREVDWTSKENAGKLRHFVYTICYTLEGFLGSLGID